MCEFALNSTWSASTGISPPYVEFGHKSTLPLEHAVCAVTDGPVQNVTIYIANMESTLQLVHSAMTHSAAYMADYANQHCCKVTFTMNSYAWLSNNNLKLSTTLSCKFTSHYVGPFKIIEQINSVAFYLLLPDCCKVHGVFYLLQLKPMVGFVPGLFGLLPLLFDLL